MSDSDVLEIRQTANMGRGVYARASIARGTRLLDCTGTIYPGHLLPDDLLAMQIGPDLWLGSAGDALDDMINHSCDPNVGFTTGEPVFYALRDIGAGEQLAWDYSTSIAESGWKLDCLCGSPGCRSVIRPWGELSGAERTRLRPIALAYLRAT